MARRLSVTHVSGPRAGETDVLEKLPARIGSGATCEVVVAGAEPLHAVFLERDGELLVRDAGEGATYLAGETVQEAPLRDGDVVELGSGGPRLRVHREGERWPLAFRGRFIFGAGRRTSRSFRLTTAFALAVGAVSIFWSQREARRLEREIAQLRESLRLGEEERRSFEQRVREERSRGEAERSALEARIHEFQERAEGLRSRLAEATEGEVPALKRDLLQTRDRLSAIESERAVGARVIRDYGAGVCLIQGSFAFYDEAGQPLRQRVDESGQPARDVDGSPLLAVEGTGDVHTIDYFGTAFLVDPRGLLLTNRHVAEPWWNDTGAEAMAKGGFSPRFLFFRAFFPRERQPFKLSVDRVSETVDLALVRAHLEGRRVPVLPLDTTGRGAIAGQPVIVLGYPTGLEAILAKADSSVVREILEARGTDANRVTEALAQKGLIRPSTTQGHIGDITRSDLVFDAPTTQGGSGGPVFNNSGHVIAVEYAVLPKFGGNAFGVPIRHAVELLRPPRRKPAD